MLYPERKYRIAIIGSGPSGFFAAGHLFRLNEVCEVDMYEKYPDPFGLIRKGIAPDRIKVKNISKVFDLIAENKRFAYFGNVDVGVDISLEELKRYYDAIILACGMETSRQLGIPGENLQGCYTAGAIVGWYNCFPIYHSLNIKLNGERAVIVGMGNVALDIARILCTPVKKLRHTCISKRTISILKDSKLKEVYIVGRRSPAQTNFSKEELLELEKIENTDIIINPDELKLNQTSQEEVDSNLYLQGIFEIFNKFANNKPEKSKQIYFTFLKTPIRIVGNKKVEQIIFEKNKLEGPKYMQHSVGTSEVEKLNCDYVISSIGYRGNKFPGVPFDETTGIIPNKNGRVVEDEEHGSIIPGLYVTGWIKRGPIGLIGHNKKDSLETVKNLLEDLPKLKPYQHPSREDLIHFLKSKSINFITYEDWKKIDSVELARGKRAGKTRVQFCIFEEMLKVLSENNGK
ncbi:MAG TPA: FAD-dependent oxidoreductase [Candidatus Hydrogenedens sp.]|nr:FAD-dependent oxidoreductase [Candidatus Hydrogenedens sp.]